MLEDCQDQKIPSIELNSAFICILQESPAVVSSYQELMVSNRAILVLLFPFNLEE